MSRNGVDRTGPKIAKSQTDAEFRLFMSQRILLVEDDPINADYLIRGLREEGYTVDHAADGLTGETLLQQLAWDVAILDWTLPGRSGLTLLKDYRSRNGTAAVLLLTAHDSIDDRVRGLDAGADDYLCKPFAFAELLARIRALSRRPQKSAPSQLVYDDLSLDLLTRTTIRAGKPILLTAKEEALLAFFLRHTGQVLTRTRIYEAVWDERYDGLSNTLEVHVMELRRKLELHGPRLIHTLRNRGYLFARDAK